MTTTATTPAPKNKPTGTAQKPVEPPFQISNFSLTAPTSMVRGRFDLQVGPVKLIGCILIAKQGTETDFWVGTQQRETGTGPKKTYRPTALLDPALAADVATAAARLYQAYLPEN